VSELKSLSAWRERLIGLNLDRSTTSSGAFSGILAYGIVKMNGVAGLKGWQWIFCLEGLVTVVVGAISFFYMHDVR
jgi:hypothetical protein